jgi:hypothetical protein
MPRATVLYRDELVGARPKASLDGLPGLVTPQIARKSAVPQGSDKNGPFATKFLAGASSTGCETVGGQIIPFLSRARVAALIQSFLHSGLQPLPGNLAQVALRSAPHQFGCGNVDAARR